MNMNMNNGCREDNCFCYFHPREVVIGVCPLCLNERLLILASLQGRRSRDFQPVQKDTRNDKKLPINFHKIFDFGSLLSRLEFRPWKSDSPDASTSQEDSFISIKFEENGKASWEKKNNNSNGVCDKASVENCKNMPLNHQGFVKGKEQQQPNKETKTVMEHGKTRGSSLRWRKRIGHVFHLIRWKRPTKGGVGHVSSNVERVKVRKGWIRTLTKKRTME